MATHRLAERFLTRPVEILVVGCGGTGSAFAAGLPYLHQTLLAFGHPHGLLVTLVDGDDVSETNCVRQPFSRSEVGLNKAEVLAQRTNAFWGFQWEARREYLTPGLRDYRNWSFVVGCVDSRAARCTIEQVYCRTDGWWAGEGSRYWLDFGNDERVDPDGTTETIGQIVLGELSVRECEPPLEPLPTVADLHPEMLDASLDKADGPSCSAVEALTRQSAFSNQVLANHGLALLAQLFRRGEIEHHAMYVNLTTGRVASSPVPEPAPPKPKRKKKARQKVRARA